MNSFERHSPRLPLAAKIIYVLTAVSALLYFVFTKSPAFAAWWNGSIALAIRGTLAILTSWIPFSLAELLLLTLPLILVILCVHGYRKHCDSMKSVLVYAGCIFCALCAVLIVFVWGFGAGYYTPTLDEKMGLERTPVSAQELFETAELLRADLVAQEAEILYTDGGASIMPYGISEMNEKLLAAYQRATEKYDFIATFPSSVKPVMLSEAMSYTHITGVYTFFTGEANINVNFPDYTLPYTAAHELAHQRGIAREDEANFVAYLICMESDDVYIRYSATLNLYEYLLSALSSADRELYKTAYLALPETIIGEERAYSAFFEKYRDNVAASISQATNDAYLKGQGATAGTKSYGMVVDLAVALYRNDLD